jgi:hypothetical protein
MKQHEVKYEPDPKVTNILQHNCNNNLSLLPTQKIGNIISGTLTIQLHKCKIVQMYYNLKYCISDTNADVENLA